MLTRRLTTGSLAGSLWRCVVGIYGIAVTAGAILTLLYGGQPRAPRIAALTLLPLSIAFTGAAAGAAAAFVRRLRARGVRVSVGRALARLGRDYRLLTRVCVTPGREDHVVIGPNGVFVILSRDESGRVTASEHRLFVNARMPWRDLVDDARIAGMRVRERLRRGLAHPPPVHAVLCFGRALVAVGQEVQGVKIVHASRLARLIASTPSSGSALARADLDAVAAALVGVAEQRPAQRVVPIVTRARVRARGERRLALVGRARRSDAS